MLHSQEASHTAADQVMIDVASIRPPSEPDAENALASALLAAPDKVAPILIQAAIKSSDFTQQDVAAVVSEVLSLWANRQEVDPIQIGIKLKGVVTMHRMTDLISCMAVPSAAQGYLEMVREASDKRKLIQGCLESAVIASTETVGEAVTSLNSTMASVMRQDASRVSSIKDLLRNTLTGLSAPQSDASVSTGFPSLDRISPMRKGDMIVIAAAAKGGKSTLALSILANVAAAGGNCLLCSLEMPSADVSEKLLARTSNVNLGRMFHRNFRDSDVASIKTAVETMSKWQLEIRDDCHDLGQILTAARLAHARKPLKMLVVDYLQLVKGSRNNGDSREREVAEVSRQLRLLGLDLGCVVVALSQLNDDGRLRESRAIGQDATAVWAVRESQEEGCRDIYIPAQRNGESGVACELVFRGEYSSFNERG